MVYELYHHTQANEGIYHEVQATVTLLLFYNQVPEGLNEEGGPTRSA